MAIIPLNLILNTNPLGITSNYLTLISVLNKTTDLFLKFESSFLTQAVHKSVYKFIISFLELNIIYHVLNVLIRHVHVVQRWIIVAWRKSRRRTIFHQGQQGVRWPFHHGNGLVMFLLKICHHLLNGPHRQWRDANRSGLRIFLLGKLPWFYKFP